MINFRFYLITDRMRCAPRSLQTVVREACQAGVRAVQLREKDLGEEELEEYTERLLEITRPCGAKLLVNRSKPVTDSLEAILAASLSTDGFHFAESVPFPHELRRRYPRLTVGVSTHSQARITTATTEGADFVTFGPVFETASKKAYGPPQGLDALAAVARRSSIPVFAIGGVTPENAADCIAAGAHGVAAIGAVMGAGDIGATVQRFADALGSL